MAWLGSVAANGKTTAAPKDRRVGCGLSVTVGPGAAPAADSKPGRRGTAFATAAGNPGPYVIRASAACSTVPAYSLLEFFALSGGKPNQRAAAMKATIPMLRTP